MYQSYTPYQFGPQSVTMPYPFCTPTGCGIPLYGSFPFPRQQPFPPVQIGELNESARKFKQLMGQAEKLINKITRSPSFARALKEAAQRSDQQQVEQMILSTGITTHRKTEFTPTGIRITLDNSKTPGGCCSLLMALRW